jgi:hypothetical protein
LPPAEIDDHDAVERTGGVTHDAWTHWRNPTSST